MFIIFNMNFELFVCLISKYFRRRSVGHLTDSGDLEFENHSAYIYINTPHLHLKKIFIL